MKLHSLHLLAPVLFQPLKRKSGHPKSVVHLATDGIDDDKPVALRSTPPAWDGVVTGEFHFRIRALPNHGPERAQLLGDDGPCRFSLIDILDREITEVGARFLYLGRYSLGKQTARQENNKTHGEDSGTFSL